MRLKDLPVKKYRQSEPWSCGPAALKILLSANGHEVSEQQLVDLTDSEPKGGTEHEGLVLAAKKLGYRVFYSENSSEETIKHFLSQGIPVLVDFQGNNGGHYAVVVGADDERVHIEDPRQSGPHHYTLDWNMFKARWFNITYGDRRFINRWMMAIYI